MSFGINAIQVVPLFCLNKIRRCKASVTHSRFWPGRATVHPDLASR